MRTFLVVFLWGIVLSGCQKGTAGKDHADNAATRYTAGLATAAEKAHVTAEKANQAIAASQAAADRMAQEIQ
jgi:hypothetical protein